MPGCRQAKAALPSSCRRLSTSLIRLPRRDLRDVVSVFTGHAAVARHLHIMKLIDSPTCKHCGLAEESTAHVICECDALSIIRFQFFGKPLLAVSEIQCLRVSDIIKFIRATKCFSIEV